MGPVEALEAALAQHVAAIQRAAFSSPPGGGPEWDALLRHYGIAPFPPQERAMIVSCMRLSRGATPGEVRVVLLGLSAWATSELGRVRAGGAAAVNAAALAALESRIGSLVDAEVSAYERAIGVAPPAAAGPPPIVAAAPAAGPSLGSIFANAQQTSKEVPWAGMTYKTASNLTCVHCGGPQEQPQDFMCKYCRRPIAGTIKPTT